MCSLNVIVIGRAFIESTGEAARTLRSTEEEATPPKDEEGHADWDRDK